MTQKTNDCRDTAELRSYVFGGWMYNAYQKCGDNFQNRVVALK
jgi:hypothetical protein